MCLKNFSYGQYLVSSILNRRNICHPCPKKYDKRDEILSPRQSGETFCFRSIIQDFYAEKHNRFSLKPNIEIKALHMMRGQGDCNIKRADQISKTISLIFFSSFTMIATRTGWSIMISPLFLLKKIAKKCPVFRDFHTSLIIFLHLFCKFFWIQGFFPQFFSARMTVRSSRSFCIP